MRGGIKLWLYNVFQEYVFQEYFLYARSMKGRLLFKHKSFFIVFQHFYCAHRLSLVFRRPIFANIYCFILYIRAIHCAQRLSLVQPVACKEYCAEYWLKEHQESMDRYSGPRNITEILLKTALNTIQSSFIHVWSLEGRTRSTLTIYFVFQDCSFSTRFKSDRKEDYLNVIYIYCANRLRLTRS